MAKKISSSIKLVVISILFIACQAEKETLFELLDNEQIGMNFSNDLSFTNDFNVYKYRNYYNGGGVSIGDINNDGLEDIYFSGNQVSDRLYLNLGNLKFQDITLTSGIKNDMSWSNGVSFEDVESKKVISSAFEKAANSIIESLPKTNPSVVDLSLIHI